MKSNKQRKRRDKVRHKQFYSTFNLKESDKLKEIGSIIKSLRKQKKWSQEILAEYSDLSTHYIYELERGCKAPSLDTVFKLADVFKVSPGYLLGGKLNGTTRETMYGHLNEDEIYLIETVRKTISASGYRVSESKVIIAIIHFIDIIRDFC